MMSKKDYLFCILASQQSCLTAEQNLALACLSEKNTKIPDNSSTESMRLRHSTGKDTRNAIELHQANPAKNPLNYFEQGIGCAPAGSHRTHKNRLNP